MTPTIYRIDFPTGDFYIGATNNFRARRRNHLASLRSPARTGSSKLAKLLSAHPVIGVYELASGLSKDTLHELESQVIADLAPTLNVVTSAKKLPVRANATATGAPTPYGPYESIGRFAKAEGITYKQAKYAAKTYTWQQWEARKLPRPAKCTHPPDPRRWSLVVKSPTGWEWRSEVRKVSADTCQQRVKRGWGQWEALTTPPRKAITLNVSYHTYHYRKSRGYPDDVCRGYADLPKRKPEVKQRTLTFNNETRTLAQWAAKLGVTKSAIHSRLKLGWTLGQTLGFEVSPPELKAQAAAAELNSRKKHIKYTSPDGFVGSVTDHARRMNVSWYLASKAVEKWSSINA